MKEKIVVDIIEQEILELGKDIMKILLKDRTTGKNIIWATNDYKLHGQQCSAENEIKIVQVTGANTKVIQPRVTKNKKNQELRTKDKAEVFTPSWICNKQNNLVDSSWFGYDSAFNIENDDKWKSTSKKIVFPEGKTWKDYVTLTRLEITCGEAPYLVSRYDTVSGKIIKIKDRIGLLDRKIRVINENVEEKQEWMKWVKKAFQSIYGFEYQGDNLLLARENLLFTFIEYYVERFDEEPDIKDIKTIATIISWNIWQMDGIKLTVPYCSKETLYSQLSLFDENPIILKREEIYCKIKDWKKSKDNIVEYRKIMEGNYE